MSERHEALVAEFLLAREQDPALTPQAFAARAAPADAALSAALQHALATRDLLSTLRDERDAFGACRVRRRLGRGASATVYEVERDGRRFALKAFETLPLTGTGGERLQREIAALRRLRHPGIVAIEDWFDVDGIPCLLLELVDGPSLHERLGVRWPPDAAIALVQQLAEAVAAAHAAGIWHRDLKPHNVALRPDGTPVLLDFGLGALPDASSLTQSGAVLGTPRYMAPEQARGEGGDARSDVHALGVILYELLAGQPARADGTRDEVLAEVAQGHPLRLDDLRLPPPLARVIATATSKQPDWRYADAGALAADLQRIQRGERVHGAGPRAWRRAWHALDKRPLAIAAGSLAVALPLLLLAGRSSAGADPLADARALRAARQFPQALAAYRALLGTRPEDASLWSEYSHACYEAAAPEPGLAAIDEAIRLAGPRPALRNTRAALLDLAARPAEAQQLLRALIAEHPTRADFQFNLAHSLDRSGQVPAAAEAYRATLAADPAHQRARISLAWLHATAKGDAAHLRDPAAAIQLACEVLAADQGRDPALLNTVVLIAQETGKPPAIPAALERAAAACSDPARAATLRRFAQSLR